MIANFNKLILSSNAYTQNYVHALCSQLSFITSFLMVLCCFGEVFTEIMKRDFAEFN